MRDKKTQIMLCFSAMLLGLNVTVSAAKDPLLAKVNGSKITKSQLESRIEQTGPEGKTFFAEKANKERLLDSLIEQEVLYLQAKKNKYQKKDEYKEKVKKLKVDYKEKIKQLQKEYLVQEFLKEEVEKKVQVSDADVETYYKENDVLFRSKPEYEISHIVLKTKDEATSLLAKLKRGASWKKSVKTYSIDTGSAEKNGKLGWVARDEANRIDVAFGDAVASLKKNNQLSGVVETRYGYHIIKRHAKKIRKRISFDSVKERLKIDLKSVKSRELYQKLLEEAKANFKITRKLENL